MNAHTVQYHTQSILKETTFNDLLLGPNLTRGLFFLRILKTK